ncbi:hypothetical protein P7C70_g3268, partial [Phenoliferia sp. Uapishka_3]
MPFFKNSNASNATVKSSSSTTPLKPPAESIFDSFSSKSPLFSPNYQVVSRAAVTQDNSKLTSRLARHQPVHSLANSIAILRQHNKSSGINISKDSDGNSSPKSVLAFNVATEELERVRQ